MEEEEEEEGERAPTMMRVYSVACKEKRHISLNYPAVYIQYTYSSLAGTP